jgi:hypothetical protein
VKGRASACDRSHGHPEKRKSEMMYPMLSLWMEAGRSDFLPRRRSRVGVSVLEIDRVSGDMLPPSDSFNSNDLEV